MTIYKHKKTGKLYTIRRITPPGIERYSYFQAKPHKFIGRTIRLRTEAEVSKMFVKVDK